MHSSSTVPIMASSLGSSHHSLRSSSSSSRPHASHVARAYRQAAQLFLTRRLPEALSTIEPVVRPDRLAHAEKQNGLNGSNGYSTPATSAADADTGHGVNGDGNANDGTEGDVTPQPAPPPPIAVASRATRVKVWSFYVSLLNAIVELGPDQGKAAFGIARWRGIVRSVRDGDVWGEVVRVGYNGEDGAVDTDVIINLATLLLTHSPSQILTQQKLESHLSATAYPVFDLTASNFSTNTLDSPSSSFHDIGSPTTPTQAPTLPRRPSQTPTIAAGASTPRDLHARLKLLELYALHVLPRNSEWELAQAFLEGSELLDEERREAFLAALEGLKGQEHEASMRQEEEEKANRETEERERERERELERKREEDESEVTRRAVGNAKEHLTPPPRSALHRPSSSSSNQNPATPTRNLNRIRNPPSSRVRPSTNPNNPSNSNSNSNSNASKTLTQRLSALIRAIQSLLRTGLYGPTLTRLNNFINANSLSSGVTAARLLVAALLAWLLLVRRAQAGRAWAVAWEKVRGTVGMGTKVSYL